MRKLSYSILPMYRSTSGVKHDGGHHCTQSLPERLHCHLSAAGFKAHSTVMKKVQLLVPADPDRLPGKPRKARVYGIPMVGEDFLGDKIS